VKEVTNGALPVGFPVALLPAEPVTIIGGTSSGGEMYVVLADSSRSLSQAIEARFAAAGFTRPPAEPGRGFMSPRTFFGDFCGDSGIVEVRSLTAAGQPVARIRFQRVADGASCRNFARPRSTPPTLELPALTPPAGVQVISAGGSSSQSHAHARGTIALGHLVAHFTAQLVAAGWKAVAPATSERGALQVLEAADASGKPWDGMLTALRVGDDIRLSLSMHQRGGR